MTDTHVHYLRDGRTRTVCRIPAPSVTLEGVTEEMEITCDPCGTWLAAHHWTPGEKVTRKPAPRPQATGTPRLHGRISGTTRHGARGYDSPEPRKPAAPQRRHQ